MFGLRKKDEPRREGAPRGTLAPPLLVQRIHGEDGDRTFFGYATNISGGGLFINATSPRHPGSRFELEFALPTAANRSLRCECEVVWSRRRPLDWRLPPGMGLRFLDLPQEDGEAIAHWVGRQRRA